MGGKLWSWVHLASQKSQSSTKNFLSYIRCKEKENGLAFFFFFFKKVTLELREPQEA